MPRDPEYVSAREIILDRGPGSKDGDIPGGLPHPHLHITLASLALPCLSEAQM